MRHWFGILFGLTLAALLLRGALPVLLPLIRFLVIFLLLYWAFRALRTAFFIKGAFDHFNRSAAGARQPRDADTSGGSTIDICPHCGNMLMAGHRCPRG